MTDPPVELSGATLIVGPAQVGKTRLTARALEAWIESQGSGGVVVLEFAPEVHRDGRLLGGRLDRFTTIPDGGWYGVIDAHAPRTTGESDDESMALARDNVARAQRLLAAAPPPTAVFVNDATIPLQHDSFPPERLTAYCGQASCAVVNAFESDALGTSDPVSRCERAALQVLHEWADRTIRLN